MALTYPVNITTTLMLCDSVEAVGGKLYILGGGWEGIITRRLPFLQGRIGVGALISVPWTETNKMHTVKLALENQDGKIIRFGPDPDDPNAPVAIEGQFNMGRPSTIQAGDSQNFPIAVNIDRQHFGEAGTYNLVLNVDDEEQARLAFRVMLATDMRGSVG